MGLNVRTRAVAQRQFQMEYRLTVFPLLAQDACEAFMGERIGGFELDRRQQLGLGFGKLSCHGQSLGEIESRACVLRVRLHGGFKMAGGIDKIISLGQNHAEIVMCA